MPTVRGLCALLLALSLLACGGSGGSPPTPNPVPQLSAISPTTVDADTPDLLLTVTGSNFTATSAIHAGGAALPTTFVSATELSAAVPSSTLSVAGELPIMVTTPAPGGGQTAAINLLVTLNVTLSPSTPTVGAGQSQQFTAAVHGASDQTVLWSIGGAGAGNLMTGTVSSSGLYTSPAMVPSPPHGHASSHERSGQHEVSHRHAATDDPGRRLAEVPARLF
jgi:IPT/TIG domain